MLWGGKVERCHDGHRLHLECIIKIISTDMMGRSCENYSTRSLPTWLNWELTSLPGLTGSLPIWPNYELTYLLAQLGAYLSGLTTSLPTWLNWELTYPGSPPPPRKTLLAWADKPPSQVNHFLRHSRYIPETVNDLPQTEISPFSAIAVYVQWAVWRADSETDLARYYYRMPVYWIQDHHEVYSLYHTDWQWHHSGLPGV